MKFCERCGRPLEENDHEICAACSNPTGRTGVTINKDLVIGVVDAVLLVVALIIFRTTNNLYILLTLMLPVETLAFIAVYLYLKRLYICGSKFFTITDIGYKAMKIVLIITYIVIVVATIGMLIQLNILLK